MSMTVLLFSSAIAYEVATGQYIGQARPDLIVVLYVLFLCCIGWDCVTLRHRLRK